MKDHQESAGTPVGHLSVHIEGEHPQDTPFLFEKSQQRAPGAAGFSAVFHVAVVVIILVGLRYAPSASPQTDAAMRKPLENIVWLA